VRASLPQPLSDVIQPTLATNVTTYTTNAENTTNNENTTKISDS